MKPIYLTMSAFGPFKDEVNIDFRKLGNNGIFLVTGDTGSGKTTIFDAISYALYGDVSGSNRPIATLRSNFAEKEKTFVELIFEHKNQIYKVVREPAYDRPKEKGKGTTKNIQSADLFLYNSNLDEDAIQDIIEKKQPEEKVISKVDNVNEKINEILGINAKQFKQISMLAQGEFLKILYAESKDRTEIFRKIFMTYRYEDLMQSLYAKVGSQRIELEKMRSSFITNIENFKFSNSEEIKDVQNLKLNELEIEKIKELIKNEIDLKEKEYDEVQNTLEKTNKEFAELSKEISKREEENNKIIEYNKLKKEKELLYIKRKEIDDNIIKIDKQEKLQIKVEPIIVELNNKSDEKETKSIENNKLEETIKTQNEKISSLSKKENVLLRITDLKNSYTECKTKELQIADKVSRLTKIKELKKQKEIGQKQYEEKNAEYKKILNNYLEEEEKFFKEQAGIIAERLEENKPCPVCGSMNHPHVAVKSTETLTKEQLDNLKAKRDIAEKENNKVKEEIISLNASLKAEIDALNEDSQKDFDIEAYRDSVAKVYKEIQDKLSDIKNEYATSTKEIAVSDKIDEIDITKIKEEFDNSRKSFEQELVKNKTLYDLNQKVILEDNKAIEYINEKLLNELKNSDFNNYEEYKNSLIPKENLEILKEEIEKYKKDVIINKTKLDVAENKLTSKEIFDLVSYKEKLEILNKQIQKLKLEDNEKYSDLNNSKNISKKIKEISTNLVQSYNSFVILEDLSKLANGTLSGKKRITFEQYVQATYFDMVLHEANKRLIEMTDSRYKLVRKKEAEKVYDKIGLDLDILDNYNGKIRDVKSLSGGEAFKAALSLALGLSDVIQSSSGGIVVDTVFIDEGFGTLDAESREKAINTLTSLIGKNKLVGIISHVSELKERIDKKIIVEKTQFGSYVLQ